MSSQIVTFNKVDLRVCLNIFHHVFICSNTDAMSYQSFTWFIQMNWLSCSSRFNIAFRIELGPLSFGRPVDGFLSNVWEFFAICARCNFMIVCQLHLGGFIPVPFLLLTKLSHVFAEILWKLALKRTFNIIRTLMNRYRIWNMFN